jgi:hypothetical protein
MKMGELNTFAGQRVDVALMFGRRWRTFLDVLVARSLGKLRQPPTILAARATPRPPPLPH